MPSFSVRSVVLWTKRPDQVKKFLYEERITGWNAASIDEAIALAENEAKSYATKKGFEDLGFFQGYWLFDEATFSLQGTEIFSLLRESDLEKNDYLDQFFDTGTERQRS